MSQNSPTVKQALLSFLTDESFWNEVENLKGQSQALLDLFRTKGFCFTPEEWRAGLEQMDPAELSEESLAEVAGGISIISPRLRESFFDMLEEMKEAEKRAGRS